MKRAPLYWAMGIIVAVSGLVAVRAATQERGLNAEEEQVVRWVDAHADEALTLLERVVNMNSGTMNVEGVREVGAVFDEELDQLGFETRWVELPAEMNRAGHLFAVRRGDGPHLLLIGHLDTVFEPESPFQAWEPDGDMIRGPGVIDMKGGNVVIVQVLRALDSVGALDGATITVALTGDEEKPGRPLEVTRRDLIEAGRAADAALEFEQGVLEEGVEYATVARRSSSGWTLEVTGRQGHSSRIFGEEYGAGAVFEAARILNGFYEEVRGEEHVTFNAGTLLGGTDVEYDPEHLRGTVSGKTNIIPRRVVAQGGLRTMTAEQLDEARAAMREVVGRSLPGTEATIEFREGYPPMPPTDENLALLDAYSRVSVDLGHGEVQPYDPGRRGAADVSFVAPHTTCLAGLGPRGSGSHGPDETLDPASVEIATERAAVLMHRIIRGRVPIPGRAP